MSIATGHSVQPTSNTRSYQHIRVSEHPTGVGVVDGVAAEKFVEVHPVAVLKLVGHRDGDGRIGSVVSKI